MFKSIHKTEVGGYHTPVSTEQEASSPRSQWTVDIVDTGDELTKEFACILLLEVTMGKDMVEEFTAGHVLENDANVLVRFDDVVKSDNVGVFGGLKEETDGGRPEMFQRERKKRGGDEEGRNAPRGPRFCVRPLTCERNWRCSLFGSASRRPLLSNAYGDRGGNGVARVGGSISNGCRVRVDVAIGLEVVIWNLVRLWL